MTNHALGARYALCLVVVAGAMGLAPAAGAQSFLAPLDEQQIRDVRAAVQAMKSDPRGPYLRIRWFCADGTTQPPVPSACAQRGGGVQHAEFNITAQRLAALHFHVGTILQPLTFAEFLDAGRGHYRLQEIVLAKYLTDTDDGWVLRQARFYRGARQIEDEEARGHQFLETLFADTAWLRRHYLLANQLVGTIPHVALAGGQTTERVRNLATEVAAMDSGFQPLRGKIHSFPSRDDLPAVEAYLSRRRHSPNVQEKLDTLAGELRKQYDPARGIQAAGRYHRRLQPVLGNALLELQRSYEAGRPRETFHQLATLSGRVRTLVTSTANGATNLALLDLNHTLLELAFVLAQELAGANQAPLSRAERVRHLSDHVALAGAAGFLSARERHALEADIARIGRAQTISILDYRDALSYLARALDWAMGTARGTFGPAYQRYVLVEPKAAGFLDAMLRASALLPLSVALDHLSADVDRLLGQSHDILGEKVSQGVRGLNPGVALRALDIIEPDQSHADLEPDKIYVLPATIPDAKPSAGVLTLDAGNLLSHIQLLARNLGIPNASIASSHLPALRAYRGREVFYAVSPLGVVRLKDAARITDFERGLVARERESRTERVKLDASRLRLDRIQPIPLEDLRATHSGVYVGPKAANLGQLGAYFPGRVAAGVALPFGMFYRHANRPFESNRPALDVLEAAYRQSDQMRAAGRDESEIDRYMFQELARVRKAILELEWLPEVRQAIEQALQRTFGPSLERGAFIRSDTNVEDLPQFSGAGLNLTVAHRRSAADVLESIRRVWTSPFTERAYLWRKQILQEQGRIYPSVLLLESVHSDKSGVLITSGLQVGRASDLTVATAEGVGGAVEGEDAEMVLVHPDGSVRLLSQAKAPYRRVLVNEGAGGAALVPASQPDTLLTAGEIRQLQAVVAEWRRRVGNDTNEVWDIEFGFARGKLWLFQIRPFVRFRNMQLLARLEALDQSTVQRGARPVSLQEPIS